MIVALFHVQPASGPNHTVFELHAPARCGWIWHFLHFPGICSSIGFPLIITTTRSYSIPNMECGKDESRDVSVMKSPEYILRRPASAAKDDHRYIKMLCVLLAAVFLTTLAFSLPLGKDLHGGAETSLRFSKDGTFQISIFEDLHFGENAWEQWGPQQDVKSTGVMNAILDAESPQLVVRLSTDERSAVC